MNQFQLKAERRVALECPFDFQPLVPFQIPAAHNATDIKASPTIVLRCTKCAFLITSLPTDWQRIDDIFNLEQLRQGYRMALNRQSALQGKITRGQIKQSERWVLYQSAVREVKVWKKALTKLNRQLISKQNIQEDFQPERKHKGSYFS